MNEKTESPSWTYVGAHSFSLEPPDIFRIKLEGDVSPDEARAMIEAMRRFAEGKPGIYLLTDLSGMGNLPAETRTLGINLFKSIPINGSAIVGASSTQRVLALLLQKGAQLVSLRPNAETRFFGQEWQARAWLDQIRRA
jgi:hypothetical protein